MRKIFCILIILGSYYPLYSQTSNFDFSLYLNMFYFDEEALGLSLGLDLSLEKTIAEGWFAPGFSAQISTGFLGLFDTSDDSSSSSTEESALAVDFGFKVFNNFRFKYLMFKPYFGGTVYIRASEYGYAVGGWALGAEMYFFNLIGVEAAYLFSPSRPLHFREPEAFRFGIMVLLSGFLK
ncbi:hypothetical protein LJC14_04395 [Treponema sp. OttesenSCG-928-L16]|nr:hypothetical protein [Treponema sp. OttesenSCG-928-L16]